MELLDKNKYILGGFMKRRVFALVLCMCMIFGTMGCSSSKKNSGSDNTAVTDSQSTESESTDSNKEVTGKVVIYTSMYEDIIEEMDKKLEEVFPNIDIEFFQGGTGTLQSKVAAEMEAGRLGCDMLMVAEPAYALELMEANMLHPYMYAEADKLLFEYDPQGYWYPVRVLNMVLAYNPDMYSKDQVPNSFEDFAKDTSMKGSISMGNPLTSGTSYAAVVALLDKYGEDYIKLLGSQEVAIESGSVAVTKLETGECKEIMILEESILKKREEEGSKLEVIYPTDGTISTPSPIMIIKDEFSANQNATACEVVEEWFLSLEGQKYIVSGWMHSVRSDYPSAPYDAIPTSEILANTINIDWIKSFKERDEIRTLFQENVTIPQ